MADRRGAYVDQVGRPAGAPHERFDRLAFARRVLRLLRPVGITVAVYEGAWDMRLEQGRLWSRPGVAWAMLAVPPWASREHIAIVLADLAGVAHNPYILELLMSADMAS